MPASEAPVLNNTDRRQFEIHDGDMIARLVYREHGRIIELIHTEVPTPLEGQGLAARLATAALDYAARESLLVKPTCPYVQSFLKRHPQYAKLTSRTGD